MSHVLFNFQYLCVISRINSWDKVFNIFPANEALWRSCHSTACVDWGALTPMSLYCLCWLRCSDAHVTLLLVLIWGALTLMSLYCLCWLRRYDAHVTLLLVLIWGALTLMSLCCLCWLRRSDAHVTLLLVLIWGALTLISLCCLCWLRRSDAHVTLLLVLIVSLYTTGGDPTRLLQRRVCGYDRYRGLQPTPWGLQPRTDGRRLECCFQFGRWQSAHLQRCQSRHYWQLMRHSIR